jgi:hypothetical protein
VHQVVAVVLGYFERLSLDTIVDTLTGKKEKKFELKVESRSAQKKKEKSKFTS